MSDIPCLAQLTSELLVLGAPATPLVEGEWSAAAVDLAGMPFADDLAPAFKTGEVVYRWESGQWREWFLVAQSACLLSLGKIGYGLYPMRSFHGPRRRQFSDAPGEQLGQYSGQVVHHTADPNSAASRAVTERLARMGHDRLLEIQRPTGGFDIVSGSGLPPLFRMNDSKGIPGRSNNVRFTKTGTARALVALQPIPALNTVASLASIGRYELLVDYRGGFWDLQSRLGTREVPLELGAASAGSAPLREAAAEDALAALAAAEEVTRTAEAVDGAVDQAELTHDAAAGAAGLAPLLVDDRVVHDVAVRVLDDDLVLRGGGRVLPGPAARTSLRG